MTLAPRIPLNPRRRHPLAAALALVIAATGLAVQSQAARAADDKPRCGVIVLADAGKLQAMPRPASTVQVFPWGTVRGDRFDLNPGYARKRAGRNLIVVTHQGTGKIVMKASCACHDADYPTRFCIVNDQGNGCHERNGCNGCTLVIKPDDDYRPTQQGVKPVEPGPKSPPSPHQAKPKLAK